MSTNLKYREGHGLSYVPEYNVWRNMRKRCGSPRNDNYPRYGGRGITVCARWLHSFSNFYKDMGPRPSNKHQIDRIDSSGNYEPANCRWVTIDIQSRNRRIKNTCRRLTLNGVTKTVQEWSTCTGIGRQRIDERLRDGWSVEKALTLPVKKISKRF